MFISGRRALFKYCDQDLVKFREEYCFCYFNTSLSLTDLDVWKHCQDRVKRIWYLSPMRAAKVQASLRIRAFSPEPSLLAHTSSESRGTFRQKARSLAPLNGWACAVKICHDGMLEDTNSLDGAHIFITNLFGCLKALPLTLCFLQNYLLEFVFIPSLNFGGFYNTLGKNSNRLPSTFKILAKVSKLLK